MSKTIWLFGAKAFVYFMNWKLNESKNGVIATSFVTSFYNRSTLFKALECLSVDCRAILSSFLIQMFTLLSAFIIQALLQYIICPSSLHSLFRHFSSTSCAPPLYTHYPGTSPTHHLPPSTRIIQLGTSSSHHLPLLSTRIIQALLQHSIYTLFSRNQND